MDSHDTGDRALKKIVVVDDDRDLAETLVMLLQAEGYDASCALSGKTGLALIDAIGADAAVLDYMLPDMWGGDVGRALRAAPASKSIPILMYTSTPEDVVRTTFDGYDAFLAKPVLHDDLIGTLDRLLRIEARITD